MFQMAIPTSLEYDSYIGRHKQRWNSQNHKIVVPEAQKMLDDLPTLHYRFIWHIESRFQAEDLFI